MAGSGLEAGGNGSAKWYIKNNMDAFGSLISVRKTIDDGMMTSQQLRHGDDISL